MSGERVHAEGRQDTGKKLAAQPTREFAFRLCAMGIGGELSAHPDYLLRGLTSRQFAEWIAYYNLHPFGHDRVEMMVAKTAAALWNQQRGKNADPITAEDFMPKQVEQQSVEEIKQALRRHIGSR